MWHHRCVTHLYGKSLGNLKELCTFIHQLVIIDSRTEEILISFDKSWTEIEKSYDDLIYNYSGWDRVKPIRSFITKLKENGANKYFRLGTSMHALMISRSVKFGLREDQKYIKIEAVNLDDYEVTMRDAKKIYREYRINNLEDPQLEKLIATLKSTLVD